MNAVDVTAFCLFLIIKMRFEDGFAVLSPVSIILLKYVSRYHSTIELLYLLLYLLVLFLFPVCVKKS